MTRRLAILVAACTCGCARTPSPDWPALVRQALERSLERQSMRDAVHADVLVATSRGCRDEIPAGALLEPVELPAGAAQLPIRRLESMPEDEWATRTFSFLRVCALTKEHQPYIYVTMITYWPPREYWTSLGTSGFKFRFRRSWGRWRIAAMEEWIS